MPDSTTTTCMLPLVLPERLRLLLVAGCYFGVILWK